jgi:hypothetical protein
MRENLTYGLKWQGVETRTWSQAPLPDPTSGQRCAPPLMLGVRQSGDWCSMHLPQYGKEGYDEIQIPAFLVLCPVHDRDRWRC